MGLDGLVARNWHERCKRWEGKDKDSDVNVLTITFESRSFGGGLVGRTEQSIIILLCVLSSPLTITKPSTLNTTTFATLLSELIVKAFPSQYSSFPSSSLSFLSFKSFLPTHSYQTIHTQTNNFFYSTIGRNSDNIPIKIFVFSFLFTLLPSFSHPHSKQ